MAKLTMLVGIPGSGKSHWAHQQVALTGGAVVSKDDIRAALIEKGEGWTWSPEAEKLDVLPIRDKLIEDFLTEGRNVYVADTNFGREHKVQLSKLARRFGAEFETVRMDVPLDVCLERNAKREVGRVPENVIKQMFYKNIATDPDRWPLSAPSIYTPVRYVADESLMKALICDLDGTLALKHEGRGFYEYDSCDLDAVVPQVQRLIRVYHDTLQFQIIYLSGREEAARPSTEAFLRKYNCPPGPLWFRSNGDHRKDRIVKLELFDAHIRDKYNVEFAVDDRPQVIRLWRELGIPTFAVGNLEEF